MPHTAVNHAPPLDLQGYWHSVGTRLFDMVCHRSGYNPDYLRLAAYGFKNLSPTAAKAVIRAAARVTPGWLPDYKLLTVGIGMTGSRRKDIGLIPPSTEFVLFAESQRAREARRKAATQPASDTSSIGPPA